MYPFTYFKESDQQVLLQFLNDHPLAFLTGSFASGKQVATQIPMLVEERDGQLYIQGHIMRNTDHHKALMENPQALAVFTGPSAYVSATWATNPHGGSTWNYMSVHIRGTVTFLPTEGLIELMKKLTLHFENGNTESPTIFQNLPDSYTQKLIPAIAGIEIKIEELENVFKLSQNRDEPSYRNIIAQLKKQGGNAAQIAHEMEKRLSQLFPEGVEWDESRFMS